MRFYMKEDRLTLDSRHPAQRMRLVGTDPITEDAAMQWFRGMDVAEELDGVTDSPLPLQCACGTREESLALAADRVRANWRDGGQAVRLSL
jgi:hypothetical protein